MLKTFAVALLATVMSVGLAQAKMHSHKMMMSACIDGKQASATCACGTGPNGKPNVCQKGQWCHTMMHACTQ